jgi:hypothetical protein
MTHLMGMPFGKSIIMWLVITLALPHIFYYINKFKEKRDSFKYSIKVYDGENFEKEYKIPDKLIKKFNTQFPNITAIQNVEFFRFLNINLSAYEVFEYLKQNNFSSKESFVDVIRSPKIPENIKPEYSDVLPKVHHITYFKDNTDGIGLTIINKINDKEITEEDIESFRDFLGKLPNRHRGDKVYEKDFNNWQNYLKATKKEA